MFQPDVLVFMKVGSGQQLKAVLLTGHKQVRAVGLCNTAAHKHWVMGNLMDYVKNQRLIALSGAPKKSDALVAWEKKKQGHDDPKPAPPPGPNPPGPKPPGNPAGPRPKPSSDALPAAPGAFGSAVL